MQTGKAQSCRSFYGMTLIGHLLTAADGTTHQHTLPVLTWINF
jgi:hypothetical protein